MWVEQWKIQLTPDQRNSFLEREELQMIRKHRIDHIREAIKMHKLLVDIANELEDLHGTTR